MKGKGLLLVMIMTAGTLLAQAPPPEAAPEAQPTPAAEPQRGFMKQPGPGGPGMGMPGPGRGPKIIFKDGEGMRMRGSEGMPGGKWWKDSRIVQDIGLSDQQATQIEKIFQDHRMQLVDLHANLEKAEIAMEPMMQADQPNEGQITGQIDKIAMARAALEKSNAVMLLGIRKVLTADQWKKLQSEEREKRPFPAMAPGPDGPGPGMRFNRRERAPRPAAPGATPQAAPTPPPGE
jgi:Spy/CpxP family protein refolding chaperone